MSSLPVKPNHSPANSTSPGPSRLPWTKYTCPGRPRRLFEVRTTEGVHAPDERRQEVRGAVGPDELETGPALEYALGDHVHQVVQVIQRHEAEVLLIGERVAGRRRGKADALARFDVHRHREIGVVGLLAERSDLRAHRHGGGF